VHESRATSGGLPWTVDRWWTGPGGHRLTAAQIYDVAGRMKAAAGRTGTDADAQRWLAQHHYSALISYQPAARYWPFQLIEGGWLLALAVALGAATIWLVRRRAA
jgi:hypothetical protein